jgi:serine/threonine protein phosphatase 1
MFLGSMIERVDSWPPQTWTQPSANRDIAAGFSPIHYGVGDIHGMRAELDLLLEMINADGEQYDATKTVVFLGDFVNRGPSSREVLERLIDGPRCSRQRWICLRGNHDQMLVDALAGKSDAAFDQFMRKGGAETLASYGLRKKDASRARARRAVPSEHLRFLEGLPLCYAHGDYFFVHAGVDPDRPLNGQSDRTMLTIRDPFLRKAHRLRCTVVHGHVPNPKGPVVAPGRIGVDTAAHESGILTAVALLADSEPRFLSTRSSQAQSDGFAQFGLSSKFGVVER